MLSLQRIGRLGVVGDRELSRLEAVHRVTRRTLTFIGALEELPAMGIGIMAIGALGESERLLEITALMALFAANLQVFAQ